MEAFNSNKKILGIAGTTLMENKSIEILCTYVSYYSIKQQSLKAITLVTAKLLDAFTGKFSCCQHLYLILSYRESVAGYKNILGQMENSVLVSCVKKISCIT